LDSGESKSEDLRGRKIEGIKINRFASFLYREQVPIAKGATLCPLTSGYEPGEQPGLKKKSP